MNSQSFNPISPSLEQMLDATALQRLRDLDPRGENRLLERVFQAFGASLIQLGAQLRDGRHVAGLQAIRQAAHTLKSSAASVGALTLSHRCAEVERLARAEKTEALMPAVDILIVELERIQRAVNGDASGLP